MWDFWATACYQNPLSHFSAHYKKPGLQSQNFSFSHWYDMLIYDLNFDELTKLLSSWGQPAFRARQLWTGLYKNFWQMPDDFTNLPLNLRQKLAESFSFDILTPSLKLDSSDGQTRKMLFKLRDGKQIETVLMRDRKSTRLNSSH